MLGVEVATAEGEAVGDGGRGGEGLRHVAVLAGGGFGETRPGLDGVIVGVLEEALGEGMKWKGMQVVWREGVDHDGHFENNF